jgi:hypothetical protein
MKHVWKQRETVYHLMRHVQLGEYVHHSIKSLKNVVLHETCHAPA